VSPRAGWSRRGLRRAQLLLLFALMLAFPSAARAARQGRGRRHASKRLRAARIQSGQKRLSRRSARPMASSHLFQNRSRSRSTIIATTSGGYGERAARPRRHGHSPRAHPGQVTGNSRRGGGEVLRRPCLHEGMAVCRRLPQEVIDDLARSARVSRQEENSSRSLARSAAPPVRVPRGAKPTFRARLRSCRDSCRSPPIA